MKTISTSLLKLRNLHLLIADIIVLSLTPLLALSLCFDGNLVISPDKLGLLLATILFLAVKLTGFCFSGFYKRYWRYASVDELVEIATLMSGLLVLQSILFHILYHSPNLPIQQLPQSLPFLDGLLSCMFVGGMRFSLRVVEHTHEQQQQVYRHARVLIVGAGSAGVSLVQQMQRNRLLGLYPVAFIDDDPEKLNMRIRGLNVVGDRNQIPDVINSLQVHKVIIAMPSVTGKAMREIADICQSAGVKTSTLPPLNEILDGRVSLDSIRDIRIEDLLRREPIQIDSDRVSQFLHGKKVLITGAGGSIGSELCRQILKCRPAQIMLLGHGENSVFNIQQELEQVIQVLREDCKSLRHTPKISACIADIRLISRLEHVFAQFKPEVIFHAAAHKHVPLMELNPGEAITNNVIGTKNLVDLAQKYHVPNFVMISTDKAVNPTNVMGASKRVAEMLVLQAARQSGKPYVAVRFGNVLGSRGSVVPTFKKQIAAGGPVTVTHPEICRYFMTIPEAVQLVLQASVNCDSGEVLMLNMGKPVKIVDLATELIHLSGYEVGKDIDIVFTGLRPGEKLHEELFVPGEEYEPTQHEKLFLVKNASRMIPDNLSPTVEALCKAAEENNPNSIQFLLEQIVPGYSPKYLVSNNLLSHGSQAESEQVAIKNKTHPLITRQLEKELQQALKQDEFRVLYQPIMCLESGDVTGFEVLLRWQHPQHGLIPAYQFIAEAETTGLIKPIGWWVLHTACQQMSTWHQQFVHKSPLTISVNLASQQFYQSDLSDKIQEVLAQTQLKAQYLRLEIAEDIISVNYVAAQEILGQIKALGIQLQISNVGRNRFFLNHLSHFGNLLAGQFDKLKIDGSLVSKLGGDRESLKTAKTIATLAHNAGLDMIAAGVETPQQLAHLQALNCEYGQGYLFSHPVEGEAAQDLMET